MSHSAIIVCLQCDRRPPRCAGACLCTVNGKDIRFNVEANYCPLGKFGPAALGDWMHTLFVLTRVHNFVKWWSEFTKEPCKCPSRQQDLNEQWRRFWHDCGFEAWMAHTTDRS